MSDPAAAGALVPAGNGNAWANGGPRFGDMVWGKVKSHPWWPGHIYSINLTDDEEVHRGRRDGLILVAFFGDSSYGWFEPHELVPFEEHFAEKAAQGGGTRSHFAAAVAEAVDEVARRGALALLCPCRQPDAFRPHPGDGSFLLVDVPGFDSDADYHPDQITAARERFVPRKALDYLLGAAVSQRDAAEGAVRTVRGIEMAGMFAAYRRAVFAQRDDTYAEAFGVDPEKALAAEQKAAAERAQRARPLKGRRKTPEEATPTPGPGRRRGGAGGAAARLMEKIVPGASAMKAKASKKDQYLLKRRDPPEPSYRPPPLPDAPAPAAPALDEGPPGFRAGDPPTPPLPGSSVADEEFMLQRRAPPAAEAPPAAAAQAADAPAPPADAAAAAAAPKKATKPKKPRKREREEAADAAAGAAGEPKKKKKKKKLSDLEAAAAAAASASTKVAADLGGLDLTQVISDIRNLPLVAFHGAADRRVSDTARSFVLAFRSKYFKKSYENDPPEDPKKSLDKPSAAAATDGQLQKKKQLAMRPGASTGDPTKAGVKRPPSDRQEEMAVKKKAKLDKIKTLSIEKKAAGLEQKDSAPAARPGGRVETAAKKKEAAAAPAPPRVRTPSPTQLQMKFPPNTTLPSVASLKARFARFGPLVVDGIRVFWKSNMCRVVYRFKSDAEAAFRYAKSNAMFGQVDAHYTLRDEVVNTGGGGGGGSPPAAPEARPQQRSELRLMETAPFRPGSSGNGGGGPLPTMSRAMPVRPALGQQPKSILKKSTDDNAASTSREAPRVKFMLDGGDSKLEPPASGSNGAEMGGAAIIKAGAGGKSVGFASQPLQPPARTLQPSLRPAAQQPPRAAVTPPQQHLPYQPRPGAGDGLTGQLPYPPRHTEGPPAYAGHPSQLPQYPLRHGEGSSALPAPPPLPYQPRSAAGFPGAGQQQQQLPYPPLLPGQQQLQGRPGNGDDMPVWKRGEKEFKEELWRLMTGIARIVEPLTDKNGFFPYHLFSANAK